MTTKVMLVDWLGRGGIAQTTEAWAIELGDRSCRVEVVTRPGRELGQGVVPTRPARDHRHRLAAHRAVSRAAAERIRDTRPHHVVVQNYVVPPLERAVHQAARDVGAQLVVVVHDDPGHALRAAAGTAAGLTRQLRAADVVVVHSEYVAARLEQACGRKDIVVLPLPVPIGLLWHTRGPRPEELSDHADVRWCGHFGVVHRGYKGTGVVTELARAGVDGWQIAVIGAGAQPAPGVQAIPGYLDAGALVAAVSATDATIAPYTRATQSAVVVLAHALGSVPVASAVGGIPEQIADGVDGLLVRPGCGIEAWRRALETLRDDDARKELAGAGESRVWTDHAEFVTGIMRLIG